MGAGRALFAAVMIWLGVMGFIPADGLVHADRVGTPRVGGHPQ